MGIALALIGTLSCGDGGNDFIDVRVEIPSADPRYWDIVTPEVMIGPGQERMFCFHVVNDRGALGVAELEAMQGAGGHHLVLAKVEEQEPGTLEDCTDLVEVQPWVLPLALPEDHAFRVPEGERFIVHFHYINTGAEPILVRDVARLRLVPEDEVGVWAAPFTWQTFDFDIPARVRARTVFECRADTDYDLLLLGGHMHENGTRFEVEHGTTSEDMSSIYLADPWLADFRDTPPVNLFFESPFHLRAGDVLRVTCEWNSLADHNLANPEEMCIAFGMVSGTTEPYVCEGRGEFTELGPDGNPVVPDGPYVIEDNEPGTIELSFSVARGVRRNPNLEDEFLGSVYGSIFRRADVTVTGPMDGAESFGDVEVAGVDLREDEVSAQVWLSEPLPPDDYVFLGFYDIDGNGAESKDPDAGDPVTIPTANEFDIRADEAIGLKVRFDLLLF